MPERIERVAASGSETVVRPADQEQPRVYIAKDEENIEEELKLILKTAATTAVVHPFNYAQVLMQVCN